MQTKITGNTKRYRVKGTLRLSGYCPCCGGETSDRDITLDRTVLADDEEMASDLVIQQFLDKGDYFDAMWIHYRGEPEIAVEPIPEDERMRLWNAPSLPGLVPTT